MVSTRKGDVTVRTRKGTLGQQLSVSDLIDAVILSLPRDAFAACAVTSLDMYEGKDDEFICGRAYGGSRAAAVSTARYALGLKPRIPTEPAASAVPDTGVLWRRVAATVAHELGHCFGVDHCVEWECVMNESNSIDEDVAAFFDLCPLDLAKVCAATGCDAVGRYEGMRAWLTGPGGPAREAQVAWVTRRMEECGGGADGVAAHAGPPATKASNKPSSKKRVRS